MAQGVPPPPPHPHLLITHFTVTVGNEAGVDLVLIQPSLLYYVNHVFVILNSIFLAKFTLEKEGGLYQNDVTLSLTFTQRQGHRAHNCKMAYSRTLPVFQKFDSICQVVRVNYSSFIFPVALPLIFTCVKSIVNKQENQ